MSRPLPPAERTVRRFSAAEQASRKLASETVDFLRERLEDAGNAKVVLTGGSSPVRLYRLWGEDYREAIDWTRVHFFWGDERMVPHEHDDSNVLLAAPLLDAIAAPQPNRHPWPTDMSGPGAARAMADVLEATRSTGVYGFDVLLLGVGPDGHVASLFPGDKPWTDLDDEDAPRVRYVRDSPKPPPERLTYTLPQLNSARRTYLLAFGDSKAEIVQQLIDSNPDIPASYVQGREQTELWTDAIG